MLTGAAIAQCRANIEAVLRSYGLPRVDVIQESCDVDRFKAFVPPTFEPALMDSRAFSCWNQVKHHGATALRGWREEVPRESLQIIEHADGRWEFDIDRINPGRRDVVSFIGHAIECLRPGKTDPFKVRDGLRKRGITV